MDNENKVTTSERELAERIRIHIEMVTGIPLASIKDEIAHLIHAENERQREVLETKTMWIAWGNTDTTEGRGWPVPLYISECKATVTRLGRKGSVMGSDCDVRPFQVVKVNGQWLGPYYEASPSKEDLQTQAIEDKRQVAIDKCRAAGIDQETINQLLK